MRFKNVIDLILLKPINPYELKNIITIRLTGVTYQLYIRLRSLSQHRKKQTSLGDKQ